MSRTLQDKVKLVVKNAARGIIKERPALEEIDRFFDAEARPKRYTPDYETRTADSGTIETLGDVSSEDV